MNMETTKAFGLLGLLYAASTVAFSTSPVAQFKPVLAPRFDAFAEQAIGTWHSRWMNGPATTEEVMRKCGGAVQGIQEIFQDRYLNRADDGFIFWNCGSYSVGPTVWAADASFDVLTCIHVSKGYRVIVHCSQYGPSGSLAWDVLSKPSNVNTVEHRWNVGMQQKGIGPQMPLRCRNIIQCRMPSESTPWNVQRLKWEQGTSDETTAVQPASESCDNEAASFEAIVTMTTHAEDGTLLFALNVWNQSALWKVERVYAAESKRLIRVSLSHSVLSL